MHGLKTCRSNTIPCNLGSTILHAIPILILVITVHTRQHFIFLANWCKIALKRFFLKIISQILANFGNLITLQKGFTRFRQVPNVLSGFCARFSTVLRVLQWLVLHHFFQWYPASTKGNDLFLKVLPVLCVG
jgi:hypothetical protein